MTGDLWAREERLWLEGAEAFRESLHPDCLMAFGPTGVMRGADILGSLEGVPRWRAVEMTARHLAAPRADVAVLACEVRGEREGAAPYRALCMSVWLREDGDWRLIQHQQTPLD